MGREEKEKGTCVCNLIPEYRQLNVWEIAKESNCKTGSLNNFQPPKLQFYIGTNGQADLNFFYFWPMAFFVDSIIYFQ